LSKNIGCGGGTAVEGQNPSGYCIVASIMMHSFFMQSLLPTLAKLLQEEDPPAKQTNKQPIYI
jgi:hypothetical protein